MSLDLKAMNAMCRMAYKDAYRQFAAIGRKNREGVITDSIRSIQEEKLLWYIRQNQDTDYGRIHHFDAIHSYADYRKIVPLSNYETYEPYIQAIGDGATCMLTVEPVVMMKQSAGSTGDRKLIPYTQSLKLEFEQGIYAWLYDLYQNEKDLNNGSSYWEITPVLGNNAMTPCGIPIGYENGADYFGENIRKRMNKLFAVDSHEVQFAKDMEGFWFQTCRALLKDQNLAFISVWNPTFLMEMCDYITANADRLEKALGWYTGRIAQSTEQGNFSELFPGLKLISCWADGPAEPVIDRIKTMLPGVKIQPKGVFSKECFVSFPVTGEVGSRLSLYSHFYEFRSTEDGSLHLADDLVPGEYEVIVTTGGGFYRYEMDDIIEVLEADGVHAPRIRFSRRMGE